jgi:hypothetical protein
VFVIGFDFMILVMLVLWRWLLMPFFVAVIKFFLVFPLFLFFSSALIEVLNQSWLA